MSLQCSRQQSIATFSIEHDKPRTENLKSRQPTAHQNNSLSFLHRRGPEFSLWLTSTARLGFGFGLGFQTLWLHSIMQNMFLLHRSGLGFGSLSQLVAVPVLGTDLHTKDRSQLHTFQSGDQGLNRNQWKNPAQYRNLSPSPNPNPSPAKEISHYYLSRKHRAQLPFTVGQIRLDT